jgi:hypothetical protein
VTQLEFDYINITDIGILLEFIEDLSRWNAVEIQHGERVTSRCVAGQLMLAILTLWRPRSVPSNQRCQDDLCFSSSNTTPEGTISVGWLKRRTIRGCPGPEESAASGDDFFLQRERPGRGAIR